MCEYSDRLIPFLDHELTAEGAVKVELHLNTCDECRGQIGVFTKVSREIDAYCDEAMAVNAGDVAAPWASFTVVAGVVTAVLVLVLSWPRAHVTPSTIPLSPVAVANSLAVTGNAKSVPAPAVHWGHRRHTGTDDVKFAQSNNKNAAAAQREIGFASPEEPIIQIAIPADEIFPPGAVPEGMNFVADMTVAEDGTAAGLRLRPLLTGFERRTTKP